MTPSPLSVSGEIEHPWPDYRGLDAGKVVRRRSEIVVGAVVFVHDVNRRVYLAKNSSPSPRHHFRAEAVIGETSRSWLTGYAPRPDKHAKADPSGLYGLDDVEDALWVDSHAWRLGDHIRRLKDADLLRAIAGMVGFTPEGRS